MKNKWILKGMVLGSVFYAALLLIKPIGSSIQIAVMQTAFQENELFRMGRYFYSGAHYYNLDNSITKNIISSYNFAVIFAIGIFLGGALGKIFFRKNEEFKEMANLLGEDKISRIKLFFGGALLLFGAKMAGGSVSDHVISGVMQLAVSSIFFIVFLFLATILIAKKVGR